MSSGPSVAEIEPKRLRGYPQAFGDEDGLSGPLPSGMHPFARNPEACGL